MLLPKQNIYAVENKTKGHATALYSIFLRCLKILQLNFQLLKRLE